jgi:outer membrane protein assembly factor BamE (lipoprotein component of BamABCDE complex)
MNVTNRTFGVLSLAAALAAAALLAGCAIPGNLPKGTSIDQARSGLVKPRGEYRTADGLTRLEFGQGPFGRQTYMLDFDAGGKLVATQQVLTENYLGTIKPGQTEESVRTQVGMPVQIDPIGWQKQHVLDYRFTGGDCVWYRVSISNQTGLVTETSLGPDPLCDGGGKRR